MVKPVWGEKFMKDHRSYPNDRTKNEVKERRKLKRTPDGPVVGNLPCNARGLSRILKSHNWGN